MTLSGLETIGLLRPWRLAQSPYTLARIQSLFLIATNPDGPHVPLDDRDLLGLGSGRGAGLLVVFEELLAEAGVHNVASLLKWVGYRRADQPAQHNADMHSTARRACATCDMDLEDSGALHQKPQTPGTSTPPLRTRRRSTPTLEMLSCCIFCRTFRPTTQNCC